MEIRECMAHAETNKTENNNRKGKATLRRVLTRAKASPSDLKAWSELFAFIWHIFMTFISRRGDTTVTAPCQS